MTVAVPVEAGSAQPSATASGTLFSLGSLTQTVSKCLRRVRHGLSLHSGLGAPNQQRPNPNPDPNGLTPTITLSLIEFEVLLSVLIWGAQNGNSVESRPTQFSDFRISKYVIIT